MNVLVCLGRSICVEQSKESYYDALHQSSQGWDEGKHELLPWTEYFLGMRSPPTRL
jgi:hypothetical protein